MFRQPECSSFDFPPAVGCGLQGGPSVCFPRAARPHLCRLGRLVGWVKGLLRNPLAPFHSRSYILALGYALVKPLRILVHSRAAHTNSCAEPVTTLYPPTPRYSPCNLLRTPYVSPYSPCDDTDPLCAPIYQMTDLALAAAGGMACAAWRWPGRPACTPETGASVIPHAPLRSEVLTLQEKSLGSAFASEVAISVLRVRVRV